MSAILSIEDVHVRYGDMIALRGVSLHVDEGELVCLIGPNGAGKSTTMTAVAGGVTPFKGDIRLFGKSTKGQPSEKLATGGLSLVPEGRHIFGGLTVQENLMIGSYHRTDRAAIRQDRDRMLSLFPRLAERISYPAGRLSGGEQQMLAVARAIMTKPRFLMIDEPSLGLAPMVTEKIYDAVADLQRESGLTLLINEQSSNRILKRADRIYVLRSGEIQLSGLAKDLQDGVKIREAYFGFDDTHSHGVVA